MKLYRLGNSSAEYIPSKQMSQSSKEVLRTLKENMTKLDDLAMMFPTGMKDISAELKGVISTITASQSEIHEMHIGLNALHLDTQCKRMSYTWKSLSN